MNLTRIIILLISLTLFVNRSSSQAASKDSSSSVQTQSQNKEQEVKLKRILVESIDSNDLYGATFALGSGDGHLLLTASAGTMNTNTQFSLASITKLFTGAVIFKLREKNLINLDDKICKYLGREILDSIDIIDNVDYSKEITIRQLLSHTSGLPDYFTEGAGGEKSKENIRKERDMSYTIKDILTDLKHLKPHFKPGEPGKAFYSDGNYQLLGLIIQKVTGKTLPELYREYIFQPLNLKNTYLLEPHMKDGFAPFYYQHKPQLRPKFIASEGPTGGMISNSNDMMIFLKAYFTGKLFPKSYLDENKNWNPIQFVPLKYGTNLMKMGNMIGHSGSTGTVAFYIPENDLFIVGATGQLDSRKTLMLTIKILQTLNYTFRM